MVLLICGLALAAIASLPVVGLLVWAVFSPASPPACYQDASATAPGGRHVATVMSCHSTMYIGGGSMWNEVDLCVLPLNSECRTVYGANIRPALAWADDHSLTITVDGGKSPRAYSTFHSAFDVTISYEVVGKTSEKDFRASLEHTKRGLEAQTSPEFVREWVQNNLDNFHAFQTWTLANTARTGQ